MIRNSDFLKLIKSLKSVFLIIIFILSCQGESNYSKILKKELKSGKIYNELIFGLKIGQTKDDFYEKCAELNKMKLVTSGERKLYPEYIMHPKDSTNQSKKIKMSFFGIFDNSIIKGLDLRFNYYTWAPWDKKLGSDYLIEEIRDTLLLWFPGNDFIKINLNDKERFAYIKIDGNRQIRLYQLDSKDVSAKIEDVKK
jgi:hypothetical protein